MMITKHMIEKTRLIISALMRWNAKRMQPITIGVSAVYMDKRKR